MSNSPLATYTAISPNSSARVKKIRKITIHHMAAKLSVETCGAIFAPSARQASSNYGIGYDGRIGQYVDENRQAWTSSSYANDQEAVTIEVSNSALGGDWPVSDKVYEKTIQLCVDICKRNGIPGLVWTGDPTGTLTCHYMFAATACPGQFLKERMSLIAKEVTRRLGDNDVVIEGDGDLQEINIQKDGSDVFRLYNPNNGMHMFTTSIPERQGLISKGWKDEGVAWKSPDTGDVVYRMYNPNDGQHMFTTSFNEAANLQKAGWKYEGSNFASGRSGVPVYRLYNPNNGYHMFTTSENERDALLGVGWRNEGTAFYAAL